MAALELSAFQKAKSLKDFTQVLSNTLNDIRIIITTPFYVNSDILDRMEDKNAIIEVSSIVDEQQLQAFFEKNGKNLIIKFKELMDQVYKESEIPYHEKIDLILNTKEKLEFLTLTFSPDSKHYFIPNIKFYVDTKDGETGKWVALDRLQLSGEQRTEVENILGVCYELCLGLRKLVDLGFYRIRLNTQQFSNYKLDPKKGTALLGEFVLALTHPKDALLQLDPDQANQLYKDLLNVFGISFNPKKPFSAARHAILERKQFGIALEQLLDDLNRSKGHPNKKKQGK